MVSERAGNLGGDVIVAGRVGDQGNLHVDPSPDEGDYAQRRNRDEHHGERRSDPDGDGEAA